MDRFILCGQKFDEKWEIIGHRKLKHTTKVKHLTTKKNLWNTGKGNIQQICRVQRKQKWLVNLLVKIVCS